ncbi:MAG: methyltransferase domain-containing protein [Myxococcales bacterium]|nr:methyltransferase domain-containing protein [Myxococcales bacterium]
MDDAAARWDHHVDTYSRLFAPLTGFLGEAMVRIAEPRIRPFSHVLDVACGPGAVAVHALRRARAEALAAGAEGRRGRVVATDFSQGMVEAARRAAAASGDTALFHAEVHDGQALGFPDGSFDAVFSSFGIFLFADRVAGWREAARVLRKGGVLGTTVWRGPVENPMLSAQMAPVMAALPERLRAQPARSWIDIAEPEALVREVSASGDFVDVEVHVLRASIVLPSPVATWEAMLDNPVMGALLAACTPSELSSVRDSVVASFETRAGGLGRPFVLDASCHALVATKA